MTKLIANVDGNARFPPLLVFSTTRPASLFAEKKLLSILVTTHASFPQKFVGENTNKGDKKRLACEAIY